jgi:predicted alpha/beta hydrolase family esterase
MGNTRILIVDDELIMRESLAGWLERDGHDVETAASGEEALKRLEDTRFDILLVDIKMEGMSGLDVLKRVKDSDPDVAVVMTMLGLYIAVFRRNPKLGLALAGLSVFWFGMFYFGRLWAIDLFNLQYLLEAGEDSARTSHWAYLQGGKLILERPLYFLDEHLITGLNLRYLFWLLFPLAFLSLASPWTLAIASPILLINMTSDWLPTHLIEYQYTATITPFVFIAAILGLVNLVKFYKTSHAMKQKDGSIHQYCSIHCLAEANDEITSDTKVVDVNSLKFIPAFTAFYVVGSRKKGTMTMNSKYAFATKAEAEVFAKENGGKVMGFAEAVQLAADDIYKDNKMIGKKRGDKE